MKTWLRECLVALLAAGTHAPSTDGSVAVGYAVSGNSSGSTVIDLGRVRCTDGWARASPFVAPTAESVKSNSTAEPNPSSAFVFRGCVPEACARVACVKPSVDSCAAATACTPSSAPFCTGPSTRPNGTSCYDGPLHGRCQSDGTCATRVHIVSQLTLELDTRAAALSIDDLFNAVGNVLSVVLCSSVFRCVPGDISVVEWRISYGNLVLDYSASVNSAEATPVALEKAAAAVNDPTLVDLPSDVVSSFSWNDTNLGGNVRVLSSEGKRFRTFAWRRNVSVCETGCGSRPPERIYDQYFCTEDGEPQRDKSEAAVAGAEGFSAGLSCLDVIGEPPEPTGRLCVESKPCCEDVGPTVALQTPEVLVIRTSSTVRLRATISFSHCDYRSSVLDSGARKVWSAATTQPPLPVTRIVWSANRTEAGGTWRSDLAAASADNRTRTWLSGVSGQTRDQPWLDIPPFALAPGSEITIELVSWLEWLEPGGADEAARYRRSGSGTAVVLLSVECSPEVFAHIAGGSMRRVTTTTPPQRQSPVSVGNLFTGKKLPLLLDGRLSSDPDVPDGRVIQWDRIVWACWNLSEPDGGRPCWDGNSTRSRTGSLSREEIDEVPPHNNVSANIWNMSAGNSTAARTPASSSLMWDASPFLGAAAMLEVSLTVTRAGRTDTAIVVIEIVDTPEVYNVSAVVADVRPKHAAREKIVLIGVAQFPSETTVTTAAADVLFNWSATHLLPNGVGKQSIDLGPISGTRPSNAVLVVHGSKLLPGATYRFVLRAWGAGRTFEGVTGVDIVINDFDQSGTMLVEPDDGLAVSDVFKLEASGFVDADLPLHYTFVQSTARVAEVNRDGKLHLLTEPSLSNRADVVLSQGDSTHHYMSIVYVRVADSYGDCVEAETMVRVRPFVTAGLLSSAAAERLEQIESRDIIQLMQVVAAFGGCINDNDNRIGTTENADELIDIIQTRDLLAHALLKVATRIAAAENGNDHSVESAGLELFVNCLRIVTDDTSQISDSSVNATLSAIEVIATERGGSRLLPAKHVEKVAATISNLLRAATILFVNANTSMSTAERVGMSMIRIVTYLGQALMTDAVVVGQDPVAVDVPSFLMSAQKNCLDCFAGAALSLPSEQRVGRDHQVSIFVPEGVFDTLKLNSDVAAPPEHVIALVVAWKQNPYYWVSNTIETEASVHSVGRAQHHSLASSQDLGSDVLGVSFHYGRTHGDSEIELRDLARPFVITLRGHNVSVATAAAGRHKGVVPYCAYFIDGAWVLDEVAGVGERANNTGAITCNHTHLTDFAAFNGAMRNFKSTCTFGCWTRIWKNNAATIPVLALGAALLLTWCGATKLYCQHHTKLRNNDFLQSAFAYQRKRVFNSDQKEHTAMWEELAHRLRHDYTFGGLLFPLQGDPYDRWQRAVVTLTAVIVNICVSLFVSGRGLSSPLDGPQCNETMDIGLECTHDPEVAASRSVSVVITALISTIIVYPLASAFVWLRQPIVRAVEPAASIHQLGAWGVVITLSKACCRRWTCRPWCCRAGLTDQGAAQKRDMSIAADEGYEAAQGVLQGLVYSKAAKAQNSEVAAKLHALARATGHHWILPREPPRLTPNMSAAWSEEAPQKRFGLTVTVVAARIPGMADKLRPYARVTAIEQDENARKLPRRTTARKVALLAQVDENQRHAKDMSKKGQSLVHTESLAEVNRRMQAIDVETAELRQQLENGDVSSQHSGENAARWHFVRPKLQARFDTLQDERIALHQELKQLEDVPPMPSSVNTLQLPSQAPRLRSSTSVDVNRCGINLQGKRPVSPRRMADALNGAGLLRTRGHKYAASARRTLSVSIAQQTQALAEELATATADAANSLDNMSAKDTVYEVRWGLGEDKRNGAVVSRSTSTNHPSTTNYCCWTSACCCCRRSGFSADAVSKYEQHETRETDMDAVTVTSTGETLYWDVTMKCFPRLRLRLWDECSGEFWGECELRLPLNPEEFPGTGSEVQKLGSDWHWPSASSSTMRRVDSTEAQQHDRLTTRTIDKDQACHWFPLRTSRETGLPDSLSEPLLPPIPKELEALAALLHESRDLLTANSKEHSVVAASQLVRHAEGTLDKKLIKQAKLVQEMHRRAKQPSIAAAAALRRRNDRNDCFRGSDGVDWLLFVLVSNQALRDSVLQQQKQRGAVPTHDKGIHIQLPGSMKERHLATAVGKLLLQHRVIAALDTGPYANQFVDSDQLLYRLCPRREYTVRGEVALRVGWAQENTLTADILRAELLRLARERGVADLREHVLKEGVSRGRVSHVIVELTQVRGLVDQNEIAREEMYALIELLVAHRYGSSTGEPIWAPYAWSDATNASTVKARPCMAMFGVTVGGAGTIGLAMLLFASYAPNLSPARWLMCAQVAVLSLALEVLLLEPAVILLGASLLRCAGGNALLRAAIEARIYDLQQRPQR